MPYGVSLIISPFNFPLLLSLGVLVASIAGGNMAATGTRNGYNWVLSFFMFTIQNLRFTDCGFGDKMGTVRRRAK